MSFAIASFNVNSIGQRLPNLLEWLREAGPEIVCLQELKCETAKFPAEAIEDLGYNCAVLGQKSYNGVAILSRFVIEETMFGLPGDETDPQSRYVECVLAAPGGPFRVGGLYLPNGNPVESEKFPYKLNWMKRLADHAKSRLLLEEPFVLAGDYNVIPRKEDCWDAKAWEGDALFRPESRAAYHRLLHLGLVDCFLAADGRGNQFTFWDYQAGAWSKDHGIRIDHILASPEAADRLESVEIARKLRGREKPSDHTPILARFRE